VPALGGIHASFSRWFDYGKRLAEPRPRGHDRADPAVFFRNATEGDDVISPPPPVEVIDAVGEGDDVVYHEAPFRAGLAEQVALGNGDREVCDLDRPYGDGARDTERDDIDGMRAPEKITYHRGDRGSLAVKKDLLFYAMNLREIPFFDFEEAEARLRSPNVTGEDYARILEMI